jgi:hypothetical protein
MEVAFELQDSGEKRVARAVAVKASLVYEDETEVRARARYCADRETDRRCRAADVPRLETSGSR